MERKTPLFTWHESHGGRMVPFAGFLLPVQYESGVIAEHNAVRSGAGLFDVSHMGEISVSGADAAANLERLFTNSFTSMKDGQVRYTLLCNESGGIVDDLVVYKLGENRYMLVVNASNREKDFAWIASRVFGVCVVTDISDSFAQIALQGPASEAILASVSAAPAAKATIPAKYYTFIEKGEAAGIPCIVSRTGYTGEDGFELYCAPDNAPALWNALLDAGKGAGLVPCGLGARDTLRLEAGMPLYGHEMDDTISPFEAGLSFAVKMEKPDFIGKAALLDQAKTGPARIRVGVEITGRGIVREQSDLFAGGRRIGRTTSGTFCPHLGKALAMALVEAAHSRAGTEVSADVRGRMIPGAVCGLPFYSRKKRGTTAV